METISRNALVLWLIAALSIIGIIAGFNMAVGPFGYFGADTVGYYFSSERMIEVGADPGLPTVSEQPIFAWARGDVMSPLLVGIAQGDKEQVAVLLNSSKYKADAPNDQALCVVAQFGHSNVARVFFRMGVPRVPRHGCYGEEEMTEEVAARFGNTTLAQALRDYRNRGETVPAHAASDCTQSPQRGGGCAL